MKLRLLFLLCFAFIALASIPPASAAPSDQGTCGLGKYWLVQDNSWDAVWIQFGDTGSFAGFSAQSMQPDVTSNLTMQVRGDQITASSLVDANPLGMQQCIYKGTLESDGATISGGTICQINGSAQYGLSWTATILCG